MDSANNGDAAVGSSLDTFSEGVNCSTTEDSVNNGDAETISVLTSEIEDSLSRLVVVNIESNY